MCFTYHGFQFALSQLKFMFLWHMGNRIFIFTEKSLAIRFHHFQLAKVLYSWIVAFALALYLYAYRRELTADN